MQTLKVGSSQMVGEALFRHDRKGTATIAVNADITRLDVSELRAAGRCRTAGAAVARTAARSFRPMPFSASWLGRSALSVTVRLGEVVGLGAKMQNASVTLASGETRFTFRAAGDRRRRLGRHRPCLRSDRAHWADDPDGVGQPRVAGRALFSAGARSWFARCRGRYRPAPARRRPHDARCVELGQRLCRHCDRQGRVAA